MNNMITLSKYRWKDKERTLEDIVEDYVSSVSCAYQQMDEHNGDIFISDLQTLLREFYSLQSVSDQIKTKDKGKPIPSRY